MLKPGGLTIIGTENHHNAWFSVRRARSWLKGRALPEFQTASHHTFYFSDKSLRRLVERHGSHVEKCLVYTPSLALKRPQYHFRHWYSRSGSTSCTTPTSGPAAEAGCSSGVENRQHRHRQPS
jgi:hypothetical protein